MKLNEYIELREKDNDVCYEIGEFLDGKVRDVSILMEKAIDVICKYRAIVCPLVEEIDIVEELKR